MDIIVSKGKEQHHQQQNISESWCVINTLKHFNSFAQWKILKTQC